MLLLVMFLKGDSLDQIGVTPKVRTKSVMRQIFGGDLVCWLQVQKQREDRESSHFSACLDENIWEYEFKRLNKHKKK